MRERIAHFEEAEETPFEPAPVVAAKPAPKVEAEAQPSLFGATAEPFLVEEEQVELPDYLTEEMVLTGAVDPLIGMGNSSPYDFQSK